MKTVKVGMVGAGQVAFHNCREILCHPQAELVAVADPSLKRAKALKKEFGIVRVYESAEDLFANPDIDAVSISVPNVLHASMSIAALNAGKHVLLDKPFAMNRKEAQAVINTARKSRKVFVLGMNQRFREDSQTVKALVERGDLGDVYHGRVCWLRRSGIPKFGTWFCRKKMAGGGVALDIGVHMFDLCLYLMGNFKPISVSAATYTVFGNRGLGEGHWGLSDRGQHIFDVDDFATALVRLRGGATVTLEVSWAIHQEQQSRHNVELFGTEGGATVFPAKLFRFGKKRGEYEVVTPQGIKGPYSGANRFTNWLDVILKQAKPCCTVQEALAVQRILDGIYTSARTRKDVRIE